MADGQRPELVEGETAQRETGQDLVDAVELGVEGGVVRGLPDSGALEADPVPVQDLPYSFPADADPPVGVRGDQPGDGRRWCSGRRGQDDHRPSHPDRALLAPAHVVQQAAALVLG
jgi:hypothetical protein